MPTFIQFCHCNNLSWLRLRDSSRSVLLPPGYDGAVPERYQVLGSKTFGNVYFWRGFLVDGDPKPAVENTRKFAPGLSTSEASQSLAIRAARNDA